MNRAMLFLLRMSVIFGFAFAVPASAARIHAREARITATFSSGNAPDPMAPTQQEYYGWNTELVTHLGGTPNSVTIVGDQAYLGLGPRLAILDITDPANPMLLGQSDLLYGLVGRIAVQGSYAYVADYVPFSPYGDRLHVFDISNPADPQEVGAFWTDGDINDLALIGTYVLLASERIQVISVADPANPHQVASYYLAEPAYGIEVEGDYAYVANSYSGILILDVSDPENPALEGSLDPGWWAQDVAISSGYAFIGTEYDLRVIQVSDPQNPVETTVVTPGPDSYISRVAVYGNMVYALSYDLFLIDVTNPSQPAIAGSYDLDNCWCNDLQVAAGPNPDQRLAYVADTLYGLRVLDVTSAAGISQIGAYSPLGAVTCLEVSGKRVFVSSRELFTLSITDPAAPQVVSRANIPGCIQDVVGDYAYLADTIWAEDGSSRWPRVRIVNVADPYAPDEVGYYDGQEYDWLETIDVHPANAGKIYAYIAFSDRLQVIDVTVPELPVATGVYTSTLSIYDLIVAEPDAQGKTYAYLAVGSDYDLEIVDVTDPYSPKQAGLYDVSDPWSGGKTIAIKDAGGSRYAFLAVDAYETDIYTIDVTNPANPVVMGDDHMDGAPQEMELVGDYAYLAEDWGNLQIVDISNPGTPELMGYLREPSFTGDLGVSGDFVYLADSNGGLYIAWFGPGASVELPTSGGVLTSTFDSTSYVFASDTFTTTVWVGHQPRYSGNLPAAPGLRTIGHNFDLQAFASYFGYLQPTQPYTVTIQYTQGPETPALESTLALYSWDGSNWVKEPTSAVDTENNFLIATPGHFSTWAVLGKDYRVFLPVTIR